MRYSNRRMGETLSAQDLDPNDKRTRAQRQKELKKESRTRFLTLPWQREAIKVIKAKIKHYKKTGNKRKLAIYELKLKTQSNLIEKLGGLLGQ